MRRAPATSHAHKTGSPYHLGVLFKIFTWESLGMYTHCVHLCISSFELKVHGSANVDKVYLSNKQHV